MAAEELPFSREAEQSVLGSVFIAPRVLPALEDLRDEDFYLPAHRDVWEAMRAVAARHRPIDVLTVGDEMRARKTLARLDGGEGYLLHLANVVPTAENVESYAAIVRERSIQRRVVLLCADVANQARGMGRADELVAELRNGAAALEQAGEGGPQRVGDVIRDALDEIEQKGARREAFVVPTGMLAFDSKIGGLRAGRLVVMGGQPSSGKTAAAAGIAAHAAGRGIATLVVSLETDLQDMVERFLGREASIAPHEMNTGRLSPQAWSRLYDAAGRMQDAPLWVDDRPWHTLRRLLATIRRWHARHVAPQKLRGLVMVDYLQLIQGEEKDDRRRDLEVAAMTRGLKSLAKELEVPMFLISSLNREGMKREGPPQMSDFRDSGVIEFDADMIIFPYREGAKGAEKNKSGAAEWIVAKNKGGPIGSVGCYWNAPLMRFEDTPDADAERQEELALTG